MLLRVAPREEAPPDAVRLVPGSDGGVPSYDFGNGQTPPTGRTERDVARSCKPRESSGLSLAPGLAPIPPPPMPDVPARHR